jgi:SAM-dependent methyltransferase
LLEAVGRELPAALLAGVDLSPRMLALARRRLGPRAILAAADAARLPFRARSFDVVLSASTLHYVRDPERALGEIHRVLHPSGRVAITDWCGDSPIDRMRDRIRRWIEPAHARVYRSAELVGMLDRAGFRDIRVERWRLGWRWGLMTATATRPVDR